MGASNRYIKSFPLYILVFQCFYISQLNAKCVCKCVNKKVEIICKKASDVKPVCMPFACDNGLIGEIPKINPPEKTNVFKRSCESAETIDLSSGKLILRENCN